MRSISREILLFCGVFTAVGLLLAGAPAGLAQPAGPGESEVPGASAAAGESEPPAEAAGPVAELQALLESAWLVADEATGGLRLVTGPRPPGARERLYTARFRHQGDSVAAGLQITVAIPAGMRYVADSAVGPGAEISFSADDGRSFAPPAELSVPADPGDPQSAVRRATADDYTHIRWRLAGEFLPDTAGLVSFRARPAEAEAAVAAEAIEAEAVEATEAVEDTP